MRKRLFLWLVSVGLLCATLLSSCGFVAIAPVSSDLPQKPVISIAPENAGLPVYDGEPYVILNQNQPDFDFEDLTTDAFERYSKLDHLGRCGVAYANVCLETMPTKGRENISEVRPSGWQSVRYDFVDGESLYNRCHLIGFQLTGENANERNLITGTRYMNTEGMLPFEELIAEYVEDTGNHVLYRVTPVFEGNNLLVSGVQLEAFSVEDEGEGICFNIYAFNVQPGVIIDYSNGHNEIDENYFGGTNSAHYVLNTGNKKFHRPDCEGATEMKQSNRQDYTGPRELLILQGFKPCGTCDP